MGDRDRFETLEENIESLIDHTREAGIIVCDYQPTISFQKKINDFVLKLQEVNRMKEQFHDVPVPVDVFGKIDAGRNPQLYTRECMGRALSRNEEVRGELDSLRRFRSLLMAKLNVHFPNEIAKYRAVRGDPVPPPAAATSNGAAATAGPGGNGRTHELTAGPMSTSSVPGGMHPGMLYSAGAAAGGGFVTK